MQRQARLPGVLPAFPAVAAMDEKTGTNAGSTDDSGAAMTTAILAGRFYSLQAMSGNPIRVVHRDQ